VERVTTRLTDDKLFIRAAPRLAGADLSLECWGANRKVDVLERVTRRKVVVVPAGPG
jgi:hypothetical protein